MKTFYISHHILSLAGLSFPLFTDRYQGIVMQILLVEVNTVIVCFRQILLNCNQTKSTAYTLVKYSNVGTIIILRVLHQARLLTTLYKLSQPITTTSVIPVALGSMFLCINVLILAATIRSDFIVHGDFDSDLEELNCYPRIYQNNKIE